jgi:hypothetical protein
VAACHIDANPQPSWKGSFLKLHPTQQAKLSGHQLIAIRSLPLTIVLHYFCITARIDTAYKPSKHASQRWYANHDGRYVHELVLSEQKWFDMRQRKGGYGAIDLCMHLTGLTFTKATTELAKLVPTTEPSSSSPTCGPIPHAKTAHDSMRSAGYGV